MKENKTKVVILCGGRGSRIAEETEVLPKPMIQIGTKPILWHIMRIYSHFGFNDFILCLGYKGYIIKEYFANYFLHSADIKLYLKTNSMQVLGSKAEPWQVTLIDTGLETTTGGRIRRIKEYVGKDTFMLTYGDGVGDINIRQLLRFHRTHGKLATVTAVQLEGRFGALKIKGEDTVSSFWEKPKGDGAWINGGFFVLEPGIFNYIPGDSTWEIEPLQNLARDGQLKAFKHNGFWKCMDTLRDKIELEQLWNSGKAAWNLE
ncbi:MAG: glucose-1-phosphate cytidylyltransferase [Candidatus Omnitrophica bacterium]|nr:glucose-1-phosphate cytidylyltransferase [Candidatus Omnitrophota bacterium]